MFIQPLVTMLIYFFLFGEYGFKSLPPVPGVSYVIWMVPGIVPWFYFSEALNYRDKLSSGVSSTW